ncbi:uncharacterized protein [Nicotiana sylvestris]|uniref:uncharacterized protein n=1 Tax=Nicotiana sylvestris TaxID=4096 RepID=UPI00388C6E85
MDEDEEKKGVNLLASKGLKKMIQAKEELSTEWYRIAAEQDQLVDRLLALEARITQMGEFKSQMEQSEQEKIAHNREAAQLHKELEEFKAKWAELQDVVAVVGEHESASMEKINNLEARLRSKIKEVAAVEEKRAMMEEILKKFMEQNCEHARTNTNLCQTYDIGMAENE